MQDVVNSMYTFEDQSSQIGLIFIFPSILYFNMPHINNHFLPPLLALVQLRPADGRHNKVGSAHVK